MVVDFGLRIKMSVVLDDRKRLVFRPFEQISATFGATVFALVVTSSSTPLLVSAEFSIVLSLERAFLALPSSDLLIFRHFRRRWPPERAPPRLRPDAHSTSPFESDGAAFGT